MADYHYDVRRRLFYFLVGSVALVFSAIICATIPYFTMSPAASGGLEPLSEKEGQLRVSHRAAAFTKLSVNVVLLVEDQTQLLPKHSKENTAALQRICLHMTKLIDRLLLPNRYSIKCAQYPYESSVVNLRDSYEKIEAEMFDVNSKGGYYLNKKTLQNITRSGAFKKLLFGKDISTCQHCLDYSLLVYVPDDAGGAHPFKIITDESQYGEPSSVRQGEMDDRQCISSFDFEAGRDTDFALEMRRMSIMAIPSAWMYGGPNELAMIHKGLCETLEKNLNIINSSNYSRHHSDNDACLSMDSVNRWRIAHVLSMRNQASLLLSSVEDYFRRGDDGSTVLNHEIDGRSFAADFNTAARFLHCADLIMDGLLDTSNYLNDVKKSDNDVRLKCVSELSTRIGLKNSSKYVQTRSICDITDEAVCNQTKIEYEGTLQEPSTLDLLVRLVFEAYSISSALSSSEYLLSPKQIAGMDLASIMIPFWFPLILSMSKMWFFSFVPGYMRSAAVFAIHQILPSKVAKKLITAAPVGITSSS